MWTEIKHSSSAKKLPGTFARPRTSLVEVLPPWGGCANDVMTEQARTTSHTQISGGFRRADARCLEPLDMWVSDWLTRGSSGGIKRAGSRIRGSRQSVRRGADFRTSRGSVAGSLSRPPRGYTLCRG